MQRDTPDLQREECQGLLLSNQSLADNFTKALVKLLQEVKNTTVDDNNITWAIASLPEDFTVEEVYAIDEAFSVAGTKSPARIQGLDLKEINPI